MRWRISALMTGRVCRIRYSSRRIAISKEMSRPMISNTGRQATDQTAEASPENPTTLSIKTRNKKGSSVVTTAHTTGQNTTKHNVRHRVCIKSQKNDNTALGNGVFLLFDIKFSRGIYLIKSYHKTK